MGSSHLNFMSFGDTSQPEGGSSGNYPLSRQASIFSLTFDEFQNTLGGSGKDFGSMNMEELLKSIWTAEDNQASTLSIGAERTVPNGNLLRQGSLTLPRTVSQKTVDEVWREVLKETIAEKNGNGNGSSFVREPTLSEMTLEEFLVKAGIVREDAQPPGPPVNSNSSVYAENFGLSLGFQQPNQFSNQNNIVFNTMNTGNTRSDQQFHQPQLPKQANLVFSSPTKFTSNALPPSPQAKGLMVKMTNEGLLNGSGLGGSPRSHLHSHVMVKSKPETQTGSPSPYNFIESGSSRRSNASVEKVVERRRKRMIKNRESASRSRARKQAYTLELEAEIANLKEVNHELRKKQEELMEMHRNQIKEAMSKPGEHKGNGLRRTLTVPW